MVLQAALDVSLAWLAALTQLAILAAAFLPREKRRKLLQHLGRGWIIGSF